MLNMSTITDSERIFKLLKFLGFASFSVENGKSVTKPLDIFFLLTSTSVGFFLIFVALTNRHELKISNSDIIESGFITLYIIALFVSIFCLFFSFCLRHKIWNVTLELVKVEEILNKLDMKIDFVRKGQNFYKALFAYVALTFPVSYAYYKIDGSLIKLSVYSYSGTYFLLSVGCVIASIRAISFRLAMINKVCESIVDRPIVIVGRNNEKETEIIAVLMKAYGKLMKISDQISFCYGIQTMLNFCVILCFALFTLFMFSKNLVDLGYLDKYAISSMLLLIYLLPFKVVEIYVCMKMKQEACNILRTLKEIMKTTDDSLKIALAASFAFMVKQKMPKLTCGLFDVDWKLIYAVS